ncbi:MAG: hypothetical protein LBM99_06685 [Bacillales bacterium]|jgi:hypothetical protein|nr:hypothetical protein [Bacillales bacterium]
MNIKKIKEKIISIFFLSTFFEGITFFSYKTFNFNLPFLVSMFLLFFGIIDSISSKIPYKRIIVFNLFVLSIILTLIFNKMGQNLYSALLYLYYLFLFLFTFGSMSFSNFTKTIKFFVIIATVFSIFGLYQFLGYSKNWPFSHFDLRNSLTVGYQTRVFYTNYGQFRAHSLYNEPSFFSQFCAISIVFSFFLFANNKVTKTFFYFTIVTNIIGLFVSFSGTGFIILLIVSIYTFFNRNLFKKVISYGFFSLIFLLTILAFFENAFLLRFFQNLFLRINEFSSTSEKTSAYIRFVAPYRIYLSHFNDFIIGYGPGNDNLVYVMYGTSYNALSGIVKVGIELGLLGISMLFCLFILLTKPFQKNSYNFLFFLLLVSLSIVGISIVESMFWCFAILIGSNQSFCETKLGFIKGVNEWKKRRKYL